MGDVDVCFCDHCDGLFLNAADLEKHVKEAHSQPAPPPPVSCLFSSGLPEPPFLARAGAVFWVRLLLLLLLYCEYFIFTGP